MKTLKNGIRSRSKFLLTDQVGTLRAVADSAGTIVKRVDYDSFGNIINDSNPGFSVPFGFAGGLHDRDTGLVRFGYRDYSPELGRFVAKDPIDFRGGDTNLYAYVLNNPVNLSDALGLKIVFDTNNAQILDAYKRVGSTNKGRWLISKLDASKKNLVIRESGVLGKFLNESSYQHGNEVVINPDFYGFFMSGERQVLPMLERVIAHEFGHLLAYDLGLPESFWSEIDVVRIFENPIACELGGYPRTRY